MKKIVLQTAGLIGILVFALANFSCKEVKSVSPVGPNWMSPARIPGIYITKENGPTPIGVIGKPDCQLTPFPNPFVGWCTISFNVLGESFYRVWVVPGIASHELADDSDASALGADGLPMPSSPIVEYTGILGSAGRVSIEIATGYGTDHPWPNGYYRIYVHVEGMDLRWGDVKLEHNLGY